MPIRIRIAIFLALLATTTTTRAQTNASNSRACGNAVHDLQHLYAREAADSLRTVVAQDQDCPRAGSVIVGDSATSRRLVVVASSPVLRAAAEHLRLIDRRRPAVVLSGRILRIDRARLRRAGRDYRVESINGNGAAGSPTFTWIGADGGTGPSVAAAEVADFLLSAGFAELVASPYTETTLGRTARLQIGTRTNVGVGPTATVGRDTGLSGFRIVVLPSDVGGEQMLLRLEVHRMADRVRPDGTIAHERAWTLVTESRVRDGESIAVAGDLLGDEEVLVLLSATRLRR